MIITSIEEWKSIDTETPIFIAISPELNICDVLFTFNLSANPNVYYPIVTIKKRDLTSTDFERVNTSRKTSLDFTSQEILGDLVTYEGTFVHHFIIGTDEREVFKHWKDAITNFTETLERANLTMKRFVKDLNESKYIKSYKAEYPEDWI